jgi:hypothetical protein
MMRENDGLPGHPGQPGIPGRDNNHIITIDMTTIKETYQILIAGDEAACVIDDWWETNQMADVRIRRAKTRGYCVIETQDTLFAQRVLMHYPDSKINIHQ